MSAQQINRYILREISVPALLSLVIFTFLLLMGRIPKLTELVVSKGVPASEIALLFSYLLPNFLSITIPLAFLLGVLLAFGRFSADSEFIALKASGVSLYALLKPVLLLALTGALVTGWLSISGVPAGKTAFRDKLFQIASGRASVGLQAGQFNDEFPGLVLYCRDLDERRSIMSGVFISDEREGETPATIFAEEGRFIADTTSQRLTLRLSNGSIHRQPSAEPSTYQLISFSNYDINLSLTAGMANEDKRHRSSGEFTWSELRQAELQTANPDLRRRFQVERYKRISVALAPIFFALVGVPLGLQSHRSGKGAGFTQALAVSLVYYLLLNIASTLASKGSLPALPALWIPNLAFLLAGVYFIHRTAIEQPLPLVGAPIRLLARLQGRRGSRRSDR